MGVYGYSVPDADGHDVPLESFKGKVLLVVNTATGCGFTPQYEQLEALYEKDHAKGLEILDIPCNQFAGQAPGSDADIHAFCTLHYHTTFPQMHKSDVNGPDELPLYAYLKSCKGFEGFGEGPDADEMNALLPTIDPNWKTDSDIKWNFTKFVVGSDGVVLRRFEPTVGVKSVEEYIESIL